MYLHEGLKRFHASAFSVSKLHVLILCDTDCPVSPVQKTAHRSTFDYRDRNSKQHIHIHVCVCV